MPKENDSRIQAELTRSEKEIELLYQVHQATLKGDSLEVITNQIITALKQITGLTAINVYVYEASEHRLRHLGHGLDQGMVRKIEKLTSVDLQSFAPLLKDGFRFADAVISGEHFIEDDPDKIVDLMKEYSENSALHKFIKPVLRLLKVNALGAVPVRVNRTPVGLITFNSRSHIEESVVNRVVRFAAEVALAMHYSKNLRKLELSDRRYEFLINNLDDAVFLHPLGDHKFENFVEVNQKAIELYGYSRDEFLTMSARDLPGIEIGDPASHAKAMHELLENGHLRWHGVHTRKDGSQFPVEVNGNLLELEGRKMIMTVIRDLSGMEEAQQALEDSERRYRTLFERSNDAIFIVDPQTGAYLKANNAALELTGYSRDELLRLKVSDVTPEGADERLARAKEGPGTTDLGLVEYIRPDGTRRRAQISSIALEDGTVFGIAHDITNLLDAEERIRNELTEKNALLHEVHHRVRNNLTVIRSLMNLQAKHLETQDDAVRAFEESKNRIFAMAMIHERLYSSGNFSQVDMRSFITQIVRELSIIYSPSKKINPTLDLQDTPMNIALAVPCGLILNELISNAIQYGHTSRGETEIRVSYQLLDGGVFRIEIEDQGPGLGKSITLETAESLGLYLVNILREQINGSVQVLDVPGTTFRIEFSDSPLEIARPAPVG